jgi:hypothetical protein
VLYTGWGCFEQHAASFSVGHTVGGDPHGEAPRCYAAVTGCGMRVRKHLLLLVVGHTLLMLGAAARWWVVGIRCHAGG